VADHWALTPEPYVEGGLVLHGFKEQEEAERFASLYLPDWQALPVGPRKEGHKAVCRDCGADWPCPHETVERQAKAILHEGRNRCHHCSRSVMGCLRVEVKGGGHLGQDLTFHGRQGKCRTAALKLLNKLGRDDELQRLAEEEDRRKRWLTEAKERKAERTARLKRAVELLAQEEASAA